MLLNVLVWHLTATALLLGVYALVVVLQWSSTRVRGSLARRRRAVRSATVSAVQSAALPGESGTAVASSAA